MHSRVAPPAPVTNLPRPALASRFDYCYPTEALSVLEEPNPTNLTEYERVGAV